MTPKAETPPVVERLRDVADANGDPGLDSQLYAIIATLEEIAEECRDEAFGGAVARAKLLEVADQLAARER